MWFWLALCSTVFAALTSILAKPEITLYLAWNQYQTFTPIAERFLQHLKTLFTNTDK